MTKVDRTKSRLTPYGDDYPACERTSAELRVYGDGIEPESITQLLGIQPTALQRKGIAITNSAGRTRVAKANGWFLSSEERVSSRDLRRHLDWLIGLLEPKRVPLQRVQAIDGVQMNVSCVWWSTGTGGPTLWPEQMSGLAELNLECAFDFYYFERDDMT